MSQSGTEAAEAIAPEQESTTTEENLNPLTQDDAPATDALETVAPTTENASLSLDKWKEVLSEELRNDPSLASVFKIEDLAKNYINTKKMVGADKIVLPTKHATEQEWKDIYHKLGLPSTVEEYEISAKTEGFNDGFVSEFKKHAHESGILPKQADQLLNWYAKANEEATAAQEQEFQQQMKENLESLKKDWGQAYDSKIRAAKKVAKAFGEDQEVNTFLEDFGSDSRFIKLLSMIGDSFLKEDTVLAGGAEEAVPPKQAQDELNSIYGNKEHPYFDSSHPGHLNAVKEVERLNQMAFGNKSLNTDGLFIG